MANPKLFSTSGPVDQEVTLADGSVEKMPFKRVGSAEWTRFMAGMSSDDPGARASAMMRLVKFSVCEPDGKEALTFAQIDELDQDVFMSMFKAAQAVNLGAVAKKT
jgi:hypothetical protein